MKLLNLVERPMGKESVERDSVTNRIGLSLQFDSSCSLGQNLVDPSPQKQFHKSHCWQSFLRGFVGCFSYVDKAAKTFLLR